jgi:hypothetical protein
MAIGVRAPPINRRVRAPATRGPRDFRVAGREESRA